MAKIAGVDGCRGGWVVAFADGWPPVSQIKVQVCGTFREVLEVANECDAIAIDIPIGLPDGRITTQWTSSFSRWPRVCDLMARDLLGPKGRSRVFLAPPRETIQAADPRSFQQLHLETTGIKASLPVWGILPKIREVDSCMSPELQDRVFEFYPELVWMDLAERFVHAVHLQTGENSLKSGELPSKHTREGIKMRLELLRKSGLSINIHWLTTWRNRLTERTNVRSTTLKLDDLLDAIAGLKAAWDFLEYWMASEREATERISKQEATDAARERMNRDGSPQTLFTSRIPRIPTTVPPKDSKGLRMEIWY